MSRLAAIVLLICCCAGCREPGFYRQPAVRELRETAADPVVGTVARGEDEPTPLSTRALLARGRERYDVYCSPCHGRAGYGDGSVVQRGFPAPPSFHQPALRARPESALVSTITHGYGRMASYGGRVAPPDRQAIAAWIKTLQLSQDVPVEALTLAEQQKIREEKQ